MSHNDTETPEYLFLDIPMKQVLEQDGIQVEEPWGRLYINAIHEGRFGDAIWARYHMLGDVEDGKVEGEDMTVAESIKQDAIGYKQHDREDFDKAVSFYKEHMNSGDGHPEVLEIIFGIDREDVSGINLPRLVKHLTKITESCCQGDCSRVNAGLNRSLTDATN
ncbi:hypothetical protein Focb16_v008524 [Fusarium oxysporum f. sp. cubense]|uniref:Uncharacterized protein n=1 Tax=Fusarium oxysporum f. sp. cubense TaxID=61366 RepID=A0A559LVL3_FUSOC|nr:hypothetical protein Focb16_v008524 [Fusarium oxysporum f. sp. cubense]